MQRVKVINEVVHGAQHLQAGETVEMAASTAGDLEKAGHVKILGDVGQKKAPEPQNKVAPTAQNKAAK